MAQKHILDGVTVLDFTQHVAGPSATRLMAEMGAEIIKVEIAPNGDQVRNLGYLKAGRGMYFLQQNRGKQSLCVDVRSDEGRQILLDLLPKVDVLIENFSPGTIGRMGLDWETVHAANPKLIMCSISTFGQTGPLSKLPGYDFIGQAYAGVTSMIGEADGPPYFPMLAIGDTATGVHALAAINGALFHRAMGGEGQHLDITLLDSYFHCHEMNVGIHSASDGEIVPHRSGRHHSAITPAGVFESKDGHMIIIAVLRAWEDLCNAMEMPELLTDPRFEDYATRVENRFELADIIEAWLKSQPNDQVSLAKLEEHRVPVAPVLSIAEAMKHPHLIERGTVRTVSDRGVGEFQMPGNPIRYSGFPHDMDMKTPFLGEHNLAVLAEKLGMSANDVERLTAEGVLVNEDMP